MGLSNWHRGPEVGDIQGTMRRLWLGGWDAGQWVTDVPVCRKEASLSVHNEFLG